jgi:hypothetical protein
MDRPGQVVAMLARSSEAKRKTQRQQPKLCLWPPQKSPKNRRDELKTCRMDEELSERDQTTRGSNSLL